MKLKRFICYNTDGQIQHSNHDSLGFTKIQFYQLRLEAMSLHKTLSGAAAAAGVVVDTKPHLNEPIGGTI